MHRDEQTKWLKWGKFGEQAREICLGCPRENRSADGQKDVVSDPLFMPPSTEHKNMRVLLRKQQHGLEQGQIAKPLILRALLLHRLDLPAWVFEVDGTHRHEVPCPCAGPGGGKPVHDSLRDRVIWGAGLPPPAQLSSFPAHCFL